MSQIKVRLGWDEYESVTEFDDDWIKSMGFDPDFFVGILNQDIEAREYILIGEELE